MDEKSKQKKKKEKNTLASIFVFSASSLANGIKILELNTIQMLENKDFANVLFLRVVNFDFLLFGIDRIEGNLTLHFNKISFSFKSI